MHRRPGSVADELMPSGGTRRSGLNYLLGASALLAAFFAEDGTERVEDVLPAAVISAINLAEVVAKLQDRGVPDQEIERDAADLDLEIIAFDRHQAVGAGRLRRKTKTAGLSLGDRC